jgi:hypothetical protein
MADGDVERRVQNTFSKSLQMRLVFKPGSPANESRIREIVGPETVCRCTIHRFYHSATSPGFGFSTRTTLSQFNRHSGSNASFNYFKSAFVVRRKIKDNQPFS